MDEEPSDRPFDQPDRPGGDGGDGRDEGGEPACLLARLCPSCDAVPDPGAAACWRCGADLREAC
ncbi:hypothetical protein BX265_0929 [Streptomyces sp. TLI_235]|nr:hypothetical protein [Streptomyces sp. TLI_235]PBC76223.1 hypothetical protein BX265_0929 [Streptomyces sp. TLI_235]